MSGSRDTNNEARDLRVDTYGRLLTRNVDSDGNSLGYTAQTTVTRPADTTAYAAGDVMGATAAAIEFTNIGPAAGHIIITDADLRIDVAALPSGMTTFRLHLYDATPASALADNAAFDLPAGDRVNYLGYIDFDQMVDIGSTLYVQMTGINKKLKMGSEPNLYGYLVTVGGFTPTSAAVKSIRLNSFGA